MCFSFKSVKNLSKNVMTLRTDEHKYQHFLLFYSIQALFKDNSISQKGFRSCSRKECI